jgi:hypothetical protein
VRFCNNPYCERCDEHLRLRDVLIKAGRALCPACHEEIAVHDARPSAPRLRAAGSPLPEGPAGDRTGPGLSAPADRG